MARPFTGSRPRAGRRLAIATAVLSCVLSSIPAGAATFTCGGFAPTTTSCSTGTRQRVTTLAHNVEADFGFVGTIESALSWTGGKRTFRCTYTGTGERTCISGGEFPDVNYGFTHRCRAIVPGTVVPEAGLDGVNGSAGTWQCSVAV